MQRNAAHNQLSQGPNKQKIFELLGQGHQHQQDCQQGSNNTKNPYRTRSHPVAVTTTSRIPPTNMQPWRYVGEATPHLPFCRGRRWRLSTPTGRETQVPLENMTHVAMGFNYMRPLPAEEIPKFNPSIPPPELTDYHSGQTPGYS